MPRVGIDGRDLLRKRTGVVNNTLHLARELSLTHGSDLTVYVDRPPDAGDEAPPSRVGLRCLTAPPVVWSFGPLP